MNEKHLDEEKYQKTRKKLITMGLIVMAIGLLIGGSLIVTGFINKNNIDNKYTEENKQKEIDDMKAEIAKLESQIQPQLDRIKELNRAEFHGFNDEYYAREDEIEAIKKEIKPIQDKISDLESDIFFAENRSVDHQKGMDSSEYIPLFMIGGFICLVSVMIGGSIMASANGRKILAFHTQSVMPVAKEGMEEMAPILGKVAEEVAKGIKKGSKERLVACPNCGAPIKKNNAIKCDYCEFEFDE